MESIESKYLKMFLKYVLIVCVLVYILAGFIAARLALPIERIRSEIINIHDPNFSQKYNGTSGISEFDVAISSLHRMKDSLASGAESQSWLLPSFVERKHGVFNVKFKSRSFVRMAGDWFDSWETKDGKVIIITGDVSGKGPSAAIAMSVIMTLTFECKSQNFDLHQAVKFLNERLLGLFRTKLNSTWAGIEISKDGEAVLGGGGSPGWVSLSGKEAKCQLPRSSLLGVSENFSFVVGNKFKISKHSHLLGVSDGVCDGARDMKEFLKNLKKISDPTSDDIINAAFKFAEFRHYEDDRSIVTIAEANDDSSTSS